MPPTASIIIPNFENGRESSLGGHTDLLGDLLESIRETLEEDSTDAEIVIADDGSRDDSLETARSWARKPGRDGRPFCRLIEMEHSGSLSRVLNRLMGETSGRIVCRFDGDVVVRTPRWLERVVATFDRFDRLGVLGGRQLAHDGSLHSVGDLLLHPHGYQHIGAGAPGDLHVEILEHDHVMGCFQMLRRAAFEEVGPYDETIPRGQTIDLGVRLLVAGWKAMTDPEIVYEHRLALRRGRSSASDEVDALSTSRRAFLGKWGFDRVAPDQDAMRRRLGSDLVPPKPRRAPMDSVGISDEPHRIANRVALVRGSILPQRAVRIVMFGGGDGSVETALMEHGIHVASIEDRPAAVEVAGRAAMAASAHKVPHEVRDLAQLPLEDDLVDLLVIDRALERHPNPIALLREADRLLAPEGVILLIARWRTPEEQIRYPRRADRFTSNSLRSLLAGAGLFRSIPFTQRPFSHPEPDVLVYALTSLGEPSLDSNAFAAIGDPTLCT